MQLISDNDDDHEAARTSLLDDFESWLRTHRTDMRVDEVRSDAQILLDWRVHYSTGVLNDYDEGDFAEFLLEWCPRKLSVPPDASDGICASVVALVEFMARTGLLVGGVDRGARLMTKVADLTPRMRSAMADPANFGMAKSLFADLDLGGTLTQDELRAAGQARMEEFNALPFEQRRELTDPFFDSPPQRYVLPFTHIPPAPADVEAAAAAVPLLRKIEALRDYLGAGKALTQKGNLKLADGRALVDLLDTGDRMDPRYGGTTFKTVSTEDLPGLGSVVHTAKELRAVRMHQRRLVPVKAWAQRCPVERATQLARFVIEQGPLASRGSRYGTFFSGLDDLLDSGTVHWLAPLLAHDLRVPFDGIVDMARAVVAEQFGRTNPDFVESLLSLAESEVSRIFQILAAAGVVEWTGQRDVATRWDDSYPAGGLVRLTALGHHVVVDLLPDAGYVLHALGDLGDADAAAFLGALDSVPDDQHDAVLSAWQVTRPENERVEMVVAAIADADDARMRLTGFVALEKFARDIVAPVARQLLDSPAAGHAALWLMARGLADEATVGSFIGIGVLVDVLATTLDEPEDLARFFTGALSTDEQLALLDDMWRHPSPDTPGVLDALGETLPDRKMAKAARKAAMRHRSWLANPR